MSDNSLPAPDPADKPHDKATPIGGANLSAAGDLNVGGDYVGRDKITTTHADGDIVGRDKITTTTIITEEHTYDVAGLPNPYLGLRSFTYAERTRFGGRDRSVEETVAKLTAPGDQRVLLVITGASGSGKSSFAQAGLLPALQAYYAQRGQPMRHAVFRPGAHPIAARDDALKQLGVGGDIDKSQPIRVLIIDQFEEIFGQSQPGERSILFNWLADLPPFSATPQHVIATLRSDYLNELFEVKPLWEAAKRGIELRAMQTDELKEAILRPLYSQFPQGDKRFEPALLDRLAQDTAGEATYLPLLQVTLEELWKKGRLGLSSYGTLVDAIQHRANQVFEYVDYDGAAPRQHRSEAEQAAILDLFLGLVNVSPDDDARRDVRTSRALGDLTPEQRLLTADLSRARLLSVEDLPNVETVNIIHETLIRNWSRLRDAVGARRQQLRRRGRFEQQLQLWEANNRSEEYLLLTNVQLAEVRELEKAADIALRNHDAQALLQQSIEHAERLAETERQRELQEARRLAESEGRRAEEAQKLAESERQRGEEQAQTNRRMRTRNRVITVVGALALAAAIGAGFFGLQANQNLSTANHNAATAQVASNLADNNLRLSQTQEALAKFNAATARSANAQSAANLAEAQTQQAKAQAASTEALLQSAEAQRQARISRARELAAAALSNLEIDPERSILLALQAVSTTYLMDNNYVAPEAEVVLRQTVQASRVRLTLTGHIGSVNSIAFSPDGKRLATAGSDNTAKVWDTTTGKELFTLTGHTDPLSDVVFSPDGKRLATGGGETAQVWDATTGQELSTLTDNKGIISIAFSPDGKHLATADWDANVWDVTTGQVLLSLTGHTDEIIAISFSPDGKHLATGSRDGTAKVWDANTGQVLLTLTGHNGGEYGVTFSPDGKRLATAGGNGTAKVWDATTGQELFTLTDTNAMNSIAYSPDGKRLATAGSGKTAKVWDATTGSELLTLTGHTGLIFGIAFSPDGKRLATASYDGTAKVWDVVTDQELLTLTGHTGSVHGIAFSPDGKRLATASQDSTAKVWDAITGQPLFTLTGHTGVVLGIAFSPDGKRLATASQDSTAKVWDAITGQPLFTLTGHTGAVLGIVFSPDGKRLATASEDNTAKVWDVTTGQPLFTLAGHTYGVTSIAFSPDGRRLATASYDRTAKVWDAATGLELFTLTNPIGSLLDVAFSPNGKLLATAGEDNTAQIWDTGTGQELFNLTGHTLEVSSIAFSPNGKRLATASWDGAVKMWDVVTGQELFTLASLIHHVVYGLAFSPDGSRLATADADGTIRVYAASIEELVTLARSRLTRTWTPDECEKYLRLDTCPPTP